MKKLQPSTIPLKHYEAMPPSTNRNSTNYYDNQYVSLFGDPVQPLQQDEYLENINTQLYSRFRQNSSLYSTNLEEEEEFPKPDIYVEIKNERPKTSRILRSGFSKNNDEILTNVLNKENVSENYSLKILPENTRLFNSNNLGPDIRILPDSGTDSSENLQNFAENKPLSNLIPLDTTYTIHRESNNLLINENENARKLSQDLEGFFEYTKYNVDNDQKRIFSNEPSTNLTREFSNESYSSSDWFKPSHDYQEFTKIPKLRPSSKNVMLINKPEVIEQDSPVATLLYDSNGSSSDEKLHDKIYSDLDSLDKPFLVTSSPQYAEVYHPEHSNQPIPQPRKLPIQTSNIYVENASNLKEHFANISAITSPIKRTPSPAIVTSTICTGAEFRIKAPKSHKTKSFSIIAENSTPSSIIETPPNQQKEVSNGRISPFLGRGFREPPRPPPRQKRALTSTNLKLPIIANTSDDSPRPSVQFDITTNLTEKSIPKSILHRRSSTSYGMPPIHPHSASKIKTFETLPNISTRNIIRKPSSKRLNKSSTDISGENRSTSAAGVRFENPTSRERGLMRIINSADSSPSRIPIKSNWLPTSLNDLRLDNQTLLPPRTDRRKSSTSTERRSSSQTDHRNSITSDRRSSNISSVTTSDFSYRRNSLSPPRRISPTNFRNLKPVGRRKSISLSPINLHNNNQKNSKSNLKVKKNSKGQRRIAKPTTLSPILGTPNKDGPLSPEEIESSSRFISNIPGTDSLTRIPIRNGSNLVAKSDPQLNLHGSMNMNSRSSSPQKEFAPVSRPNSRVETESPVKVTNRSNSRISTSRTSRPASRVDSKPPSRTSSRASSYQSNNNMSRSNSRLSISPPKSISSTKRNTNVSKKRSPSPKKGRKKSISPTKSTSRSRTRSRSRSRSKSPEKNSKGSSRPRHTKESKYSSSESPQQSNSRKGTNQSAKISKNDKKKSTKSKTSSSSSANRKNVDTKSNASNFKRSGSNIRKEGLTRESSSIRKKEPLSKKESSNLKREPSSLKREPSSLKKESSNLKRDSSRISLKKEGTNTLKREPSMIKNSQVKKEPSNVTSDNSTKLKREPSNLMKKRTDSNLSKKLDTKNSTKIIEKKEDKINGPSDNIPAKEDAIVTNDSNEKLIPLTKQNVVSMTTAAITAQPVQITTAVTNQIPLTKTNSSGQLIDTKTEGLPSAILEKSQKTLENIQKTVTDATDEIHKTINENLTDLKSLETDMGKNTTKVPKVPLEKTDSLKTIMENSTNGGVVNTKSLQPIEASVSVVQGSDHLQPSPGGQNEGIGGNKLGEDMAERVSERAISVLPDVECESANLQKNDHQVSTGVTSTGNEAMNNTSKLANDNSQQHGGESGDGIKVHHLDEIRDDSNNNTTQNLSGISQEHLDEDLPPTGCCGRSKCCKRSKCCTRLCMPCRRSRCCRKKQKEAEEAIMKEVDEVAKKTSCWKGLNCCKRKPKTGVMGSNQMETIAEESDLPGMAPKKQNKCGLCLRKFFCCRATNKIETTSAETENMRKCCFCIPCRRKRPVESRIEPAWMAPPPETSQRRESILSTPAGPPESRCTRFMNKLKFWKKKEPSRRPSMGSRKQSLAPTNPPEDTRPKLHNDLVEYNSKMKGAIPVLPIYLAYFCTGCNIICPGLGTILSGLFCLCVGIPRFSQYDSAKARIGSFVINCIVGVSQLFCVLFCFVGWGWSIWWGTIMMRTAKKLQKIRKVERLELEEEQRQAQVAAAAATAATTTGGKPIDKDVEAGKP